MKDRHIRKYMRLAKQVGEDSNPCYSRHIGVVIVRTNGKRHKIVGTGYNGPPSDTPHCDAPSYLKDMVWPQLTDAEKDFYFDNQKRDNTLPLATLTPGASDEQKCEIFVGHSGGCKTCPRKLVGAQSGKRLELCSCVHAETNAIVNASEDLEGCYMFCWCGVPCMECTKLILQSGIKKVFVIDWGADYSFGSRWLFDKKGVEIVMRKPDWYEKHGDEE